MRTSGCRATGSGDTEIEGATEASYTIAATDVGKTLKVRVTFTDDGNTEETLTSDATGAVLGALSLSVADAQVQEGPGATLDFVIAASPAAVERITVYYRTHDGTAKAGADYTAADGSVVFSPGDTQKTVSVAVLEDAHDEGSETVKFWLSGVRGIAAQQISDPYAVGTILSGNAMPPEAPRNLSLAAPEGREGELVVSWEAPGSDGGAALGGYTVQWKSGGEDYDGSASSARQAVTDAATLSHTIVGLANGVAYTVRVMAVNAAGDGAAAEATATAQDRAAPALSGAAVNGAALTLAWSEALDDGSVPAADAFAVTMDGAARGVGTVEVSGSAVTLNLASAVASGEAVAVSYTVPTGTGAALLRDAAGNSAAGFSGQAVTNETPAPENTAPTGLPVIGGTARVGEVLTASVEGIEDADGLAGAAFAYQWLSGDGTGETPIGGATEAAYTVAATDVGRTLAVRVRFTDEGGTEETLESAPSAAVAPALAAVSIAAVSSPVTEGAAAAFTLSRTGDASAPLSVAVAVSESGAMLAGAPAEAVTFEAGASTAALGVATEDDEAVEEASEVTATVAAGDGYTLATASATVTAEDDDAAPVVTTAPAIAASENGTEVATLKATDEDTAPESLAWSIAGGADADKFTLTEGGVLAFGSAKDYEAPDDADTDGAYAVTVRVGDGVNTGEAALTVTLTDVDEAAPELAGAAVNGTALTLAFSEALDDRSVPAADAFAVTTARRAVSTLASAVASGAAVAVSYTVPTGTGAAPLRDAAGNAVAAFSGEAVTNETPAPENTAPTGVPTIGGTARVGGARCRHGGGVGERGHARQDG